MRWSRARGKHYSIGLEREIWRATAAGCGLASAPATAPVIWQATWVVWPPTLATCLRWTPSCRRRRRRRRSCRRQCRQTRTTTQRLILRMTRRGWIPSGRCRSSATQLPQEWTRRRRPCRGRAAAAVAAPPLPLLQLGTAECCRRRRWRSSPSNRASLMICRPASAVWRRATRVTLVV